MCRPKPVRPTCAPRPATDPGAVMHAPVTSSHGDPGIIPGEGRPTAPTELRLYPQRTPWPGKFLMRLQFAVPLIAGVEVAQRLVQHLAETPQEFLEASLHCYVVLHSVPYSTWVASTQTLLHVPLRHVRLSQSTNVVAPEQEVGSQQGPSDYRMGPKSHVDMVMATHRASTRQSCVHM